MVTEPIHTNGTILFINFTTHTTEVVRCVALETSENAPTPVQVIAGTNASNYKAQGIVPSPVTTAASPPVC